MKRSSAMLVQFFFFVVLTITLTFMMLIKACWD